MLWTNSAVSLSLDGETIPSKDESCFISIKDGHTNNYYFCLRKEKGNNQLKVWLALTANNAKNILLYDDTYKTVKEAKYNAKELLIKLDSLDFSKDINTWKKEHITPVFNESFEIVGDIYTSIPTILNHREFDYFNKNPIPNISGKFYVPELSWNGNLFYYIETIKHDFYSAKSDNKTEIIEKLLNKMPKGKYKRFFRKSKS